MAKVLSMGGVFFRSRDPESLGNWYRRWLGVENEHPHGASFQVTAMPPGGVTVWSPFPSETEYFGPSGQQFMVNLVVDDLDGALEQVRSGGAEVAGREDHDYGSFGWFVDPDGNRVELWQPKLPG